jgi:hypothetical protein
MSGTGVHVRWWMILNQGGNIKNLSAGGIQFWATDGTNTGYWYVGGADTYPGGWYNFVIDVSRAVDAGTKPTAMNAITSCGFRIDLTANVKKTDNTWIDHFCICDGLKFCHEFNTGAQTISVVASAGTFTRAAGSYLTDGFEPGMRIETTAGFLGANTGTFIIDTVTATVITVTDNTGLSDETGSGDEVIEGFFGIEHVTAADEATTLAIGVLRDIGGVNFCTGSLLCGDSTNTYSTKFQSRSAVIVYEDRDVNSALYDFEVVDGGGASFQTKCILGSKSGTSGIEGCLIRVESLDQTPIPTFTATDTDNDFLQLYGTTFLGFGAMNFPATATDIECISCNFERCGEIDPDTMKFRKCNFIASQSSTLGAVKIDTTSFDVDESNFIGCNRAVRFPSGSQNTYNFYDLVFSGNTYDVRNEVTTGNTVTINKNGTSDPSTSEEPNGGTTSFVASYPETVTCKNTSGYAIEGIRVRIEKQSDGSLVDEGTTNASGIFSDTYPGAVPLDVKIKVRLKGYKPASALDTITTDGLSVPFTMIRDPAVDLP